MKITKNKCPLWTPEPSRPGGATESYRCIRMQHIKNGGQYNDDQRRNHCLPDRPSGAYPRSDEDFNIQQAGKGPTEQQIRTEDNSAITDKEFMIVLKEHPEIWGLVMDALKNHHSVTEGRR